ncbi:MAG: FAD-binding protein, partial [Planctomycetota bacterium]|nr:FAD-binding protein [Planctomycetota bacterium]
MTDALHDALAAALGEDALVTDAHDLARYEKGWRYGEGSARLVARPRTHEEVAEWVRLCNEHGARVQPAGANTGLVGASTPDGSGQMVVLSLERLSRITNIDDANG